MRVTWITCLLLVLSVTEHETVESVIGWFTGGGGKVAWRSRLSQVEEVLLERHARDELALANLLQSVRADTLLDCACQPGKSNHSGALESRISTLFSGLLMLVRRKGHFQFGPRCFWGPQKLFTLDFWAVNLHHQQVLLCATNLTNPIRAFRSKLWIFVCVTVFFLFLAHAHRGYAAKCNRFLLHWA